MSPAPDMGLSLTGLEILSEGNASLGVVSDTAEDARTGVLVCDSQPCMMYAPGTSLTLFIVLSG